MTPVLSITCRRCLAKPGTLCIRSDGRRIVGVHSVRRRDHEIKSRADLLTAIKAANPEEKLKTNRCRHCKRAFKPPERDQGVKQCPSCAVLHSRSRGGMADSEVERILAEGIRQETEPKWRRAQ